MYTRVSPLKQTTKTPPSFSRHGIKTYDPHSLEVPQQRRKHFAFITEKKEEKWTCLGDHGDGYVAVVRYGKNKTAVIKTPSKITHYMNDPARPWNQDATQNTVVDTSVDTATEVETQWKDVDDGLTCEAQIAEPFVDEEEPEMREGLAVFTKHGFRTDKNGKRVPTWSVTIFDKHVYQAGDVIFVDSKDGTVRRVILTGLISHDGKKGKYTKNNEMVSMVVRRGSSYKQEVNAWHNWNNAMRRKAKANLPVVQPKSVPETKVDHSQDTTTFSEKQIVALLSSYPDAQIQAICNQAMGERQKRNRLAEILAEADKLKAELKIS